MKKKLLLAAVSAVSIFTLAACSGGSDEIASMKGGKITVEDFYNEAKLNSTNQSIVRDMIIYQVFENNYGDKVSKEEVNKEYDKTKENFGDSFDTQLANAGYTETTYKAYLKQNLALQEGLKAHIDITDDDLKTAWASFHPEVEAQIITAGSEEDATAILKEITDGGDFTKIAKEKSTDTATKEDGGKIKFDSQSTDVPSEVKEAAFKLKDGEVSEVVTSMDSSTYATTYYVVKMTKNQAKGNDMKPYEKEVKQIAEDTKLADQTFVTQVIKEELTDANVKIKDDAFKSVLSDFIDTEDSSEASTEASTKESTEKSTEATDASEEASTEDSSK